MTFGGVASPLTAAVGAAPTVICGVSAPGCAAGVTDSRVTLATSAGTNGSPPDWPAVQVVFLLETNPWDGVFDNATPDNYSFPCSSVYAWFDETYNWQNWPVCMESNAVPVFVAHAGEIAEAIAASHPNSNITFALIDFFATHDKWDDSDGNVYHVDISHFVPADRFGAAVNRTFQQEVLGGGWYLNDSELHDDSYQSSIITAMYGALTGQGLNWSRAAHHVVVWIGSGHPRDAHYLANECAAPTAWLPNKTAISDQQFNSSSCWGPTVEPAYQFANGQTSPAGVGWITGPNGSIAKLAHTGLCAESLGGNCTVDVIVPYSFLSVDAKSPSDDGGTWWTTYLSLGRATCDIANATGGTWEAPNPYYCYLASQPGWMGFGPHWVSGYYDAGYARANDFIDGLPGDDYTDPNTTNPHLVTYIDELGLGQPPPADSLVARATPSGPTFLFVPYGNISVVPTGPFSVTCTSQYGYTGACPSRPQFISLPDNRTALGWNWSTDPVGDYMLANDSFTATFEVQATGPPYNTWVPVDACSTSWCLKQGSGPESGFVS